MDWIKIRLNELELRVFGRVTTALDALARLLGRDPSFSQALAYVIEESILDLDGNLKAATDRVARILRDTLNVRIVTEDALDHIVILYAPATGDELPLCDLSDKNGLIWRSVDS